MRALAEETFASRGVRSPVGLFMSRIAEGEHRTIEIKPALVIEPLPQPKPCPECNLAWEGTGSAAGSVRALLSQGRARARLDWCGLYGGRHVEGCPNAVGEAVA